MTYTGWFVEQFGQGPGWFLANLTLILAIAFPVMVGVALAVYADRKIWAAMQMRRGPNVVGPFGLLQTFADAAKLFLKETIIPTGASTGVFLLAPMISFTLALVVWAVMPFDAGLVLADLNVGLLYVFAVSSMGVYGIILGGWASNSKYAVMGALRAASQVISYEIAMGFALAAVLVISGTLNLSDIVKSQQTGYFASIGLNFLSWNWLPLLPMFLIYFISGVAELNRHPFDVVEGESEIVAGHMIEYSGMAFAMFFLAEYANMILIAALTSILFFGGWAPIVDLPILRDIPGIFWLIAKTFFFLSCFIWLRASFPRYRYDQLMRLGWKVFIPISIFWILLVGAWVLSPWNIWK